MIPVALVDDHVLLRDALARCIHALDDYHIILTAANGQQFIQTLDPQNLPGIVLLDIIMPQMNGFETALWISRNYPQMRIIVVSMLHDESAVTRMLRNGAKGYVRKDADLAELKKAMEEVMEKGIYFNQPLYNNFMHSLQEPPPGDWPDYHKVARLSPREKEFLKWLCTDMAYKEIAAAMFVSPRTVDGYRDTLLEKLEVSSRIGLVMFAIRNHIAEL